MKSISSRFMRRTVWETLTPEQLVERYMSGTSLDDLGMLTGTSSYRVRKILVEQGVEIRPSCGSRGHSVSRYLRK